MWTAKISIPYMEKALFSNIAKKNNISIVGYPLSNYIKNNHLHVIASGFLTGDEKDIKNAIKEIKKDSRLLHLEVKDKFIITEAKQHISNKLLFQQGVIHLKPSIVAKNGDYIFELGSWDKQILVNIIEEYRKYFNVKCEYLKERKVADISTLNLYPNLTEKQKKCLQLAINNHYYDYPRRITLKQLAKIAKISYSTYQFHLQNAEKKMMPFLNSMI